MEWMIMPYRRYAEFSGRSRRKEYWMYVLFVVLVSAALQIIDSALGLHLPNRDDGSGPLSALFGLGSMVPSIAVGIRRLHDTDRSGWWLLLPLAGMFVLSIPLMLPGNILGFSPVPFGLFIGLIVLFVFLCRAGTKGENRFGADPKAENVAEIFA